VPATSNNMKLVHWPLMGGLLHLVQRGGDWSLHTDIIGNMDNIAFCYFCSFTCFISQLLVHKLQFFLHLLHLLMLQFYSPHTTRACSESAN